MNTIRDFIAGLCELLSKAPEQLTDVLLGVGLRATRWPPRRLLACGNLGSGLRGASGRGLAVLAADLDNGIVKVINRADHIWTVGGVKLALFRRRTWRPSFLLHGGFLSAMAALK
jgi:hypothetical protein